MNTTEYRDILIRDGIRALENNETDEVIRRGGIKGFEMCRELISLADYEILLEKRHRRQVNMINATVQCPDKYQYYQSATLQIQCVYERMKARYVYCGGAPPQEVSGRALKKFLEVCSGE